jgi:hypothetical protein
MSQWCPPGQWLCPICFECNPKEKLHVKADGTVEDVCIECADMEDYIARNEKPSGIQIL